MNRRNHLRMIDMATATANTIAAMLLAVLALAGGSALLPWLMRHALATITHRLDLLLGVLR